MNDAGQSMKNAGLKPMRRPGKLGPEIWLLLLVLFGAGYFYNAHNWNHISRFDGMFSFVEPGTPDQHSFRIDHFIVSPPLGRNTGDWARNPDWGPHYYSNKSPGLMLLGVPVYFVLYHVESALGAVPESQAWTRINTYLLNFALSIVPLAVAALAFFRLLVVRFALASGNALALTAVLVFGTVLFPYATQLWGHVTAAAFLILALASLWSRGDDPSPRSAAWAGFFVGLAVLAEYSAAITFICLSVWFVIGERWRALVGFGLGGLPALAAHAVYHRAAFGSVFAVANAFNNPKFIDEGQLAGVFGALQPEAMFGLTFSAQHGLFFFMPILLLAGPALFLRDERFGHAPRIFCVANLLLFLVMNLSFNGWHGGFCLGPRYLIPVLPFAVLLLVPLFRKRPSRVWLAVTTLLFVVSVANMSLLAMRAPSTTFIEQASSNPLADYYRAFLDGRLGKQRLSPLRLDGDWLVDGRVQSARNGLIAFDPPAAGGTQWRRASATLRMKEAGEVRMRVGYAGAARITIGDFSEDLPLRAEFGIEHLALRLEAGENPLEVALRARKGEGAGFYFLALASKGRPRLPRASVDAPEFSISGTNAGELLGIAGVASVVPWMVGMTVLGGLAWRSLHSGDGAVDYSTSRR